MLRAPRRLTLLLTQLARCVELVRSPSFVSQVVAPSLNASIGSFMAYPHSALSFSLPAVDLGFLDLRGDSSTASIQDWLYGQAVATKVGESGAITMLYIGLEDGRFLGFKNAEGAGAFTLRRSGDALARDVDWNPVSLDDVSAACRVVQGDDAVDRRLDRPCRRHRECGACLRNGCGSCATTADAPVEPIVQSDCGVGAPSDAWDAIARAHCIVDQTGGACCDGNIRASYAIDTSLAMHTSHGDLTSWSIYDHRRRDWYLQAARRWEETGTPSAWSRIYSCYESGKYCITATAVASRLDGSGRSPLIGIFAADYELDLLKLIIEQGTDGIAGTWAYLVERGSDKIIASSANDPVYSLANSSTSGPIRESAEMLQARGWPGGHDIDRKRENSGWEAHTTIFEGLHGLDWLIIVGQNLNCTRSQIWNFGQCLDCPPGQAPAKDGQVCSKCPLQGQVPDTLGVCAPCPAGFHADAEQVECVLCPAGKYSGDADLQCSTCEDPTRMVPNGGRTDCECAPQHYNSSSKVWRCFDSEFWSDGVVIHDASSAECDECPPCANCQGADALPQLKPGFRVVALPASTEVRAFLCATTVETAKIACQGGQNYQGLNASGSDYGVIPCTDGYDGVLCQSCAQDFHRIGRECVHCAGGWWSSELWVVLLLLSVIGLWKYWGKSFVTARVGAWLDQPVDATAAANATDKRHDTAAVENPVARDDAEALSVEALPRNSSAERRLRLSTNVAVQGSVRLLVAADPEKALTVAFRSMFTPARTLITYFQVTAQIGRVIHMQLPGGYMQDIVNACKPLLDTWELFVSADCAGYSGFHHLWLAKVVALPTVCLLVIFAMYLVDMHSKVPLAAQNAAKTRVFFAIFFFYPTICNALFSTFNCRDIAEDQSLLVDDDRIFCESTAHRTYWQISMVLIVLFAVGVPVSVFNFLLQRRREYDRNQQDNEELIERVVKKLSRLDQQSSADSRAPAALSKYAMTATKANILLREVRDGQDVAFLLSSYNPSRHYWECLDMLRKFCLVGVVLFVPRGSAAQVLVAVLMSGFFLTWHVKQWPFKDAHDNVFRAVTEVHVFITFAVCLALRGAARDEDGSFEQMASALTFLSFLILIPGGFVVTAVLKLQVAQKLLKQRPQSPTDRLRQAAERVLKGFGDDQDCEELMNMFDEIQDQILEEFKNQQLTDDDRRILVWVREELDLESTLDDQDTISQARAALHLPELQPAAETNVSKVVQELRETIVESTRCEDGVFLSHYQMYGPDVMDLKGALVKAGIEHAKIWYDKDNDPSERNMRLGVRNSRYFLLYLTEGVLERPFCRKEIRWCLMYKKEVVLLWKQDGPGSIASFGRFFADCHKKLNDDSHEGLVKILSTAAVPYYLSGDFRSASMSVLLEKLGHPQDEQEERHFGFAGMPPMVHIGYCREKVTNARAVQTALEALAPQLGDQVHLGLDRGTALGGAHVSAGDVVVVYLTEGIFDDPVFVSGLKALLQERHRAIRVAGALRKGVNAAEASPAQLPIILVVESDMRHGWSQYQAFDREGRKDHGWQDALRDLQTRIDSEFFTKGWISAQMFEHVIPFYKDISFRNKSLACILKQIGAMPMDADELRRVVEHCNDVQLRNRQRAGSIGEGSAVLTRQMAVAYDS